MANLADSNHELAEQLGGAAALNRVEHCDLVGCEKGVYRHRTFEQEAPVKEVPPVDAGKASGFQGRGRYRAGGIYR